MACKNLKSNYPRVLGSSQLELLNEIDLLANCDRRQAISQYEKLLIKENHAIFSKTVVVGLLFYINK